MKARITKRLVEQLEPQVKLLEVWDSELPGFLLRLRPSGRMTWLFSYRNENGRRVNYKLGNFPGVQPEGARVLAKEAAGKVAARIDIQAAKQAARVDGERERVSTLGNFIAHRYEAWALSHLKRGDVAVARLRSDFRQWADEPLTSFNCWRLESWRRDRLKSGVKPVTLNRQLDTLRSCLAKAVEWGVLPSGHPMQGLKRLRVDEDERVRYLSPAEEHRLREALVKRETREREARVRFNEWRAARHKPTLPVRTEEFTDHLRPLVIVALNTGLRRGELFSLKWSDLDLDHHAMLTVRAAASKSGDSRRVPLNTEAVTVLRGWKRQRRPADAEAFVFAADSGARLTNINKSWATLCELAQITNFRFHDLRHSFASKLVQRGANINHVRALLGHSDLTMTLRYAHLQADTLAETVAKLA